MTGNSGITQPATPVTYGTSTFGATENFVGTKDANDLVLGTNNVERLRILDNNGYIGIGTTAPDKPLVLISNIANVGLVRLQNTNPTGYSSIDIWNTTTQIGNIGYSNGGTTYPNSFYFATNTLLPMVFGTNNVERVRISPTGNVGIGVNTPTAALHLEPGTAAATTAPLKFSTGVNLTTPENGAIEFDGSNFYSTSGGVRFILAETLMNTATLDFPSIAQFSASDLTISVPGAVVGDVVSLGVPASSVVASSCYTAFVSLANTVVVRFNNYLNANSPNPASGTFRVSVIKY